MVEVVRECLGLCLIRGVCKTVWPSGGGSQWEDFPSGILYSGGSVGIGTADPQAELDVDGSVLVSGILAADGGILAEGDVITRRLFAISLGLTGANFADGNGTASKVLTVNRDLDVVLVDNVGGGGGSLWVESGGVASLISGDKIAVGVDSPSGLYGIEVLGGASFADGKFTVDGSGNLAVSSFVDSDNPLHFIDPSNFDVSVSVAGVVQSVSIGTTSPNYFLGPVGMGTPDPRGGPLDVQGGGNVLWKY